MRHLRTHVLMLSIGLVTVLAVLLTADDGAERPAPEVATFRAAELQIEPAPTPRPESELHARSLARRAASFRADAEADAAEAEALAAAKSAREREQQAPAEPPAAPTGSVWDRLAGCESGGNWASSAGRYEGGLQFHPDTWDAHKPSGYPDAAYEASRAQQIAVAERVLASQGWGAWPSCSSKLGLR